MGRARVLVVEDRPTVLKLLATVLEGGYEVGTAADGEQALALLGTAPYDVVLADVRMPGATGFDVLEAVRRRSPRTAVVLMTAYANVPDAVEAMRLGAADYIAKPVDADDISLAVARAVERQQEALGPGAEAVADERYQRATRGASPPALVGFHRAIEEARDAASREYLARLLKAHHGNVTQAARQARMTRESLHRVLKKYGVRCEDFRRPGEADQAAGDAEERTS